MALLLLAIAIAALKSDMVLMIPWVAGVEEVRRGGAYLCAVIPPAVEAALVFLIW